MANELFFDYASATSLTARIRSSTGQGWHVATAAYETYGSGGHAASSYDISMTDRGGGFWQGNAPSGLPDGDHYAQFWDPSITDQPVGRQTLKKRDGVFIDITTLMASGDHAVSLTIRTTGGTPLSGVRVWLSVDGDRENPVCAAQTTNDAGVATFYCDYSTAYYVHCRKSGYNFAYAAFTPASGSVSFTKDIASSATVSGADSDYAGSFLVRAIADVRDWAREPVTKGLYSDDYLIRRLGNSYALALGEINRLLGDVLVARFQVTLNGTGCYRLPSTFGPIETLYYEGDMGTRPLFWTRNSSYDCRGHGVWVEGNLIRFQAGSYEYGSLLTVEAWPTGTAKLNCGTCSVSADGKTVTLGATPYLGELDQQINAYVGSMLRIIKVTGTGAVGDCVQEMPITAHVVSTRALTLQAALDPIPAAGTGGYIFYEIAPVIPIGFDCVVAARTAWEINLAEGQKSKAAASKNIYDCNMRSLRLDAWNKQLQDAGQGQAGTFTNERYSRGVTWPT